MNRQGRHYISDHRGHDRKKMRRPVDGTPRLGRGLILLVFIRPVPSPPDSEYAFKKIVRAGSSYSTRTHRLLPDTPSVDIPIAEQKIGRKLTSLSTRPKTLTNKQKSRTENKTEDQGR